MFNGDPSMPPVTNVLTEQIQMYLEENQQLILAIMECRKLGKFSDLCKYQNKLQYNLSYLAKVADAQPQAQTESELLPQFVSQREQGIQYPHKALSQPQLDLSSSNMPFQMNDRQQQQCHVAASLKQPDLPTSKFPFQMNDHCQQQHYGAFSMQCNTSTTDQQHQQHHAPISSQQLDQSTSKLHFQMTYPQLQRHIAIFPQQLDASTSKLPFQMFDQQHQQCHAEIFVQKPDLSNPKFQMNNQQQHHVVMSPKKLDASTSKLPLMMNDQQKQLLVAFSQQQSDVSASKLPLQMIDPQQQHHAVTSVQQPDLSNSKLTLRLNDQQQCQHHPVSSLKQTDLSTSKLPFEMNDWKQKQHKQPAFFQQQRLIQGPMNSLPGTDGGVYQASESGLGINLSDTQESNQSNSDACPGISGKVNFWTEQ